MMTKIGHKPLLSVQEVETRVTIGMAATLCLLEEK